MLKEMVLDDWQKEALEYPGDLLLCTGRRVGKTLIMSIKAIERMVKKPKTEIVVVSLTEDQAELIISMALEYLTEKYKTYKAKGAKNITKRKIVLKNKSKLISRPVGNTGDSVRGFTGDVLIVDEASRMPPQMWMAAKPILLTTGGHIWMCSTPFGRQGYFYKQFHRAYELKDPKARFKVIYKNTEDVVYKRPITHSWTKENREDAIRVLEEDKKEMSRLEYGQEYMGLFMEDLMQFFPDNIIKQCMILSRSNLPSLKQTSFLSDYFLGVDIARMGSDESTFQIFDRTNRECLIHVDNIVTTRTLLTMTTRMILQLDKKYKFRKIYIDDGGIGVGVFDQLLEEVQTRRKVVGINNLRRPIEKDESRKKKILKEDLYNNLLNLMERGKIQLLDDPEIYQSLRSVQYEYRDNGTLRIFGNYTHIAEGIIRAAWCVKDKSLKPFVYY